MFPKAPDVVLKCFVLFCPQPKDIHYAVAGMTLESEN